MLEGFGIVLLEAMAAARPIVAARAAAIPVVAPHGLLVDPDSAEALAGGIETLWSSPDRGAAQASAGAAWVERFDAPRVGRLFVETVTGVPSQEYSFLDIRTDTRYGILVIRTFRHRGLKRLYQQGDPSKVRADQARRIADVLGHLDTAAAPVRPRLAGLSSPRSQGRPEGHVERHDIRQLADCVPLCRRRRVRC